MRFSPGSGLPADPECEGIEPDRDCVDEGRCAAHRAALRAHRYNYVQRLTSFGQEGLRAYGAFRETLVQSGVDSAHLYALTRICQREYTKSVESVFEIIAEPNRRAILGLLVLSQQSVGEIERQLGMPQPTVSKHLRVLREAGFVESTVDAQRRLYRLNPEPLQEVDVWLAPFRRFWSVHLDALEQHLDRMERSTRTRPSKKKTQPRTKRIKPRSR